MVVRSSRVVVVAALLGACGPGGRNALTDAGPAMGADAPPDADPHCHIDCFGRITCLDGVQAIRHHEPISCDDPSYPECNVTEFECLGGCRLENFERPWGESGADYQPWLCLAESDAMEGQRCDVDYDCWPSTAILHEDGELSTLFLECIAGQCAAASGPALVDLWQPCLAPAEPPPAESLVVAIDDPGWPDPLAPACLMYLSATCLHAARTQLCWGDWHCPNGSYCETGAPLPICRPGPRTPLLGVDLPCALQPQ